MIVAVESLPRISISLSNAEAVLLYDSLTDAKGAAEDCGEVNTFAEELMGHLEGLIT
jgi:hypothetical protein